MKTALSPMPTISYTRDLKSESVRIITDLLFSGYYKVVEAETLYGYKVCMLKHRRNKNRIRVMLDKTKLEVWKNDKLRQTVCLPRKK